jgi:hypothetical protein
MVILPNVKAFGEEMQSIVKSGGDVSNNGDASGLSRAAEEAKLCLTSVEVCK